MEVIVEEPAFQSASKTESVRESFLRASTINQIELTKIYLFPEDRNGLFATRSRSSNKLLVHVILVRGRGNTSSPVQVEHFEWNSVSCATSK